jgi:hypothetical protein
MIVAGGGLTGIAACRAGGSGAVFGIGMASSGIGRGAAAGLIAGRVSAVGAGGEAVATIVDARRASRSVGIVMLMRVTSPETNRSPLAGGISIRIIRSARSRVSASRA